MRKCNVEKKLIRISGSQYIIRDNAMKHGCNSEKKINVYILKILIRKTFLWHIIFWDSLHKSGNLRSVKNSRENP